MKNEAFTVDKSKWPPGPWQTEPDKLQWIDKATGLDCLIVRGPHGALCGYVGVPETHPHFGHHYDDANVEVHGGLTYASKCDGGNICHVLEPGRPDNVWWLGFDCAHFMDITPAYESIGRSSRHLVYRDVAYVREQCAQLASQLAATPPPINLGASKV